MEVINKAPFSRKDDKSSNWSILLPTVPKLTRWFKLLSQSCRLEHINYTSSTHLTLSFYCSSLLPVLSRSKVADRTQRNLVKRFDGMDVDLQMRDSRG